MADDEIGLSIKILRAYDLDHEFSPRTCIHCGKDVGYGPGILNFDICCYAFAHPECVEKHHGPEKQN